MKIEHVIILFSILLLAGFGLRMDVETDIQIQKGQIAELKNQIINKSQQIAELQEQLIPPPYARPVKGGAISSPCGIRRNPFGWNVGGQVESLHRGVDIALPKGSPVYAALAGVVVEHFLVPGWHGGIYYEGHKIFGGMITIKHEDGLFSKYAHLSKSCVKEGQIVEMGEKIGAVGSTGLSSGPHLHWEFIVDGFKFLNERILTRDSE